jgi:cytochrome P450
MAKVQPRKITFELFSPQMLRDPYPYYHQLRESSPVHRFDHPERWAVSRWADVVEVLQSPDRFSSLINAVFSKTIVGADPPAHTRVRKIVTRAFSARAIAALEATIRTVADELVDDIARRGSCEWMTAFATPLPLLVVAHMMGLDRKDRDHFARWTGNAVGETGSPADRGDRAAEVQREFQAFFEKHVDQCREGPPGGLIRDLLHPDAQGECLSRDEAVDFAKFLLIAGSETTTNLTGNAALALIRHPAEMALVRETPSLIPGMLEEALRYDSPAQRVRRQAVGEQEIAGVRIPAGAQMVVLLGSANRDPDHFPDPDRFDIRRNPKDHVALGAGPHYCLGARLARLEARIGFETVFERLGTLRAAQSLDDVEFHDALRGPRSLMLAFEKN